jgi:hypothetical protein
MKKYLRLTCSVCKRSADRLVDNTRFTPDKCTITFKCEGRLFPVEYRSDGGITSAPEVGVTDWRPRGTTATTTPELATTELIETSTGKTQQIVVAVPSTAVPLAGSQLTLTLNQRVDTPKAYRQYIYRFETSFTSVSGVESGLEKKTLRYGLTDSVEVFVNGVKQVQGTAADQYQIYDGSPSSPVPPNNILFNSAVAFPGVTQVDVIVAPAVSATQVTLTFNRNVLDESRKDTGSWENVDIVQRFNGTTTWTPLYLFTLDLGDATALKLNTILSVDSIKIGATSIPLTNAHLLLARSPFTQLDRYLNLTAPLANLSSDANYFKYFVVDGKPVLRITETAVAPVFPVMRAVKFSTEKTIQVATAGDDNQIVVDGAVIVGPDA